jgi:hypothetical protein
MKEEISKVVSLSGLKEVKKSDFNKIKEWKENEYRKIRSDLQLLLEGQKINQKDLRLGFIGLAKQNSELLDLNKELTQQLETTIFRKVLLSMKRFVFDLTCV